MKKHRYLRGKLFDIERELRSRNSGADEAISEAQSVGRLRKMLTSMRGSGITAEALQTRLKPLIDALDRGLQSAESPLGTDIGKKNESWSAFFFGFAKSFGELGDGGGIEHGHSHVLKDFFELIRKVSELMIRSKYPEAATCATSVLTMISIWLTKHANDQADVRKPTLVEIANKLRMFLSDITSHPTLSTISVSPSSLSGIDGESDRAAVAVEYAEVVGDQVKIVTDGINADQMQEGYKDSDYSWEQVTADTDITEGVAGFTSGIVGLLGMIEGMKRLIEKKKAGTPIEFDTQEFLNRLKQAVSVAEGATGLVFGGAIGVESMAGEAVSAFSGGFGDLLATLKSLIAAYEKGKFQEAIETFIHKHENTVTGLRTQLGRMMKKISAQAVADVQWFLELDMKDVPNLSFVYMPSKEAPVTMVQARQLINQYLVDPVVRHLITIQIAESSLSKVSKDLGAKAKLEGLNAVASGVSAAGVVTSGLDAGTVKILGIALKTGAFLTAIEQNRRLNLRNIKGVEAMKAELGKQTRDGSLTAFFKSILRGSHKIAEQKEKLETQLEVLEKLATEERFKSAPQKWKETLVLEEWDKARCMPVNDRVAKAKLCVERFEGTENRATRIKLKQNALTDSENFAIYFYNTMTDVPGYPYKPEAKDLLSRISLPDWPYTPGSPPRLLPPEQAKRMLTDKIDR